VELSTTPRAASGGAGGLDDQVYQRLLKERIIFLGSVVEDSMANAICAQMLLLAAEDPEKDIYLYINSPGGSISAGMAIYDTMQYIKNDVATIQAEQMSFTKKSVAELISFHTGQNAETITEDSDRDRWFTAAEAKEYGFVDHVVKSAGQVSGSGGTSR